MNGASTVGPPEIPLYEIWIRKHLSASGITSQLAASEIHMVTQRCELGHDRVGA